MADPTFKEKMDRIWHGSDDFLHKAMSHLFAAKSNLLYGDDGRYRYHLVTAMRLVGTNEHCRRTSATAPLALFDRYVQAGGIQGTVGIR